MGFGPKILGPKCSACCLVVSVWGIAMFFLLGIFFQIKSPALREDVSVTVPEGKSIFVFSHIQGGATRTGQRTGQKPFFCKNGQARIGQATLFWLFLGQARKFFGFFDFYSFLNRF